MWARVAVAVSHIGVPRGRRNPVDGYTPMTRMSASRAGAMIDVNWRSASTLTRNPVPASTTINTRGTVKRGSAAALGSVMPAMCQSGTTAGITQIA